MNRRNLIKSIPFLGIAPLAVADQKCPSWPLESTLLPFQQKIWEAYNKYDRNLFIMPRGSGKTFMFNRLFEINYAISQSEKELREGWLVDDAFSHHHRFLLKIKPLIIALYLRY